MSRKKVSILIDQSHRQAWSVDFAVAARMNPVNPKDASYSKLVDSSKKAGFEVSTINSSPITKESLEKADVLVLPHASTDDWEKTIGEGSPQLSRDEISAIKEFVTEGGGLVVLGETEQSKYGNNFAELTEEFGITFKNETIQDPEHNLKGVPTWIKGIFNTNHEHDLGFQVEEVAFYRAGVLEVQGTAHVIATSSRTALPADAPIVAANKFGNGRVIVLADSDVFGDDSIEELANKNFWLNIATWVSGGKVESLADNKKPASWASTNKSWIDLATAIENLRPLQENDGSIDATKHNLESAAKEVAAIIQSIAELTIHFLHQDAYLKQVQIDLRSWVSDGFQVPDFYDSLELFRPDLSRIDGIENFAVFSMYTQNGSPNTNLEAVITRTFWPEWLAQHEKIYQNRAFVPIEFVAYTTGYDTNSAVFFPETVSTRALSKFHWGGIFCDREAARFRLVSRAAQKLLHLRLPPDAERLVNDQALSQESYVLWDLIHDRTHSRGDLPFDPFMIKKRMPFWMYGLEELRCDLSTFKETFKLEKEGEQLGRYIRYAILFDRLFRFPITGSRVRNYDGLAGQIMFSHLLRNGGLSWTNNKLSFKWEKVDHLMVDLCTQVEVLYHEGIDRSRLSQWLASYQFVSELVEPHPSSIWAKGADHLPLDGETKVLLNLIQDDEFPLNVFYETLNRNLKDVVAMTKGITA